MKKTICLLICICSSLYLFAQKNEQTYIEKAKEIQAKIWGDKSAAEFEIRTISADLEKESAVVIARSIYIQQTTGSRLKFVITMPTTATRTSRVITYRDRIKINDKAALKKFSTLAYQKTLDQTRGFLHIQQVNKKDLYLGIKLIKPDGQEIIVNTGEEVLIKNEAKDKEGKLAIPGLQVGDILDYYVTTISTEEDFSTNAGNSVSVFTLADEYMILNYDLTFQYNKNVGVNFVAGNGAPKITESTGDNDDKLFDIKAKNIGKMEDALWTLAGKQYPYVKVAVSFTNKYLNFISGVSDNYDKKKSPLENSLVSFEKVIKEKSKNSGPATGVKRYFRTEKALKEASIDSVLRVFYDYDRFIHSGYATVDINPETVGIVGRGIDMLPYRIRGEIQSLADMDIKFDILFVATKDGVRLDDADNISQLAPILRINSGDKQFYMSLTGSFSHFNEIPTYCQGEEAMVLTPKDNSLGKFAISKTILPVSAAIDNYINNEMAISFDEATGLMTKIDRTVSEGGGMRPANQTQLLTRDEIAGFYTSMFSGIPAVHSEPNSSNFSKEIQLTLGQEPKNLANCKVTSFGLSSVNPEFNFRSSFELSDMVKSVGNDRIFNIGKIIGPVIKVEAAQRIRTVDVYMPSASTLTYNVTVAIPRGYRVKGVEELNYQIQNETGEVSVMAKVSDGNVIIKVKRVFEHNFEKATAWPRILALLDATYNFSEQKILFEKI